jgi:toxin HigB-1
MVVLYHHRAHSSTGKPVVFCLRPHKQKLRMRLTALDTATYIEDMDIPGWRLHSLKGNREGLWAIDVSRNWRIVFEFSDGNAYAVDYEDYH